MNVFPVQAMYTSRTRKNDEVAEKTETCTKVSGGGARSIK